MNRLRERVPEQSLEQLCGLFGKTRQAYYRKLNYNYQEYAEDGIILDLVQEYRQDMDHIGGRKLWNLIHQSLEHPVGDVPHKVARLGRFVHVS